jgi:preprotein translocase subunit Sec63
MMHLSNEALFLLALAQGLAVVLGAFIAWWVNRLWNMTTTLQKQHSDMAVKLAEGYVPRAELENTFRRLLDSLDDIRKELGHISRNQGSARTIQEYKDRNER